ncbi:MAG: hypothetical protein V2A58_13400 [Planctomycetota bacterium]
MSKEIKNVDVLEEFRVCPACNYQRGFRVSFFPLPRTRRLRVVLICPDCGARYDIRKSL